MFHGFFQNVPKDWHLEIYLQLGNKTAIRSFVMPDLSAIIPGGRLTLSPITPIACGSFDILFRPFLTSVAWTAQQQQPSTTSALPSHFEDRPIEDVLALCADERIFTVLLRLQTHIFSLTRRLLLCISVTHVRGKNTYLLSLLKFYFIL